MTLGYRHPVGPLRSHPTLVGLPDVRLGHRGAPRPRGRRPALRPRRQILRDKVAAGELGRKTGRGFYDW